MLLNDAARKMLDVTVTQSQAAAPYRLTVEVGVTDTAGAPPRVTRVELSGRQATASMPADAEPVKVSLDPGTWLLMDAGPFSREP